MSFTKRVSISLALMSALLLVGTSAAQATITPVKVLGGRLDQQGPGVNASYLGWSQERKTDSPWWDGFVKNLATGEITKLNQGRSWGGFGGIEPGTDAAVYVQYRGWRSNIMLIDLDTMTRTAPPAGINTDLWEYGPTISASWILFGRMSSTRNQLILWNRATDVPKVITSMPYRRHWHFYTGSVSERYASWTKCSPRQCRAFYYDTGTQMVAQVPTPDARHDQYAPAASDASGYLYFTESEHGVCGSVSLMRWRIGGSADPAVLVDLPSGFDTSLSASVFTDSASNDNYYYAQWDCRAGQADIYELPGAQT